MQIGRRLTNPKSYLIHRIHAVVKLAGPGATRDSTSEDPVDQELAIFTGRAHPELARNVCATSRCRSAQCDVFEFSNENIFVRIQENVRSRDVFIVQSLCSPVNTSVMELLIMIDAFRRASAGRITAVIPYYAYGRSDKKDQPRVPITARLLANLIETAGADRVLTIDLHAGQIQGFFNIPVDELTALYTSAATSSSATSPTSPCSRPTSAAPSARATSRACSARRWRSSTRSASATKSASPPRT